MRLKEFCSLVNELAQAGKQPYVERHIVGRMGPVTEAKPLGFGTRNAMIKIYKGGWINVDPLMCKVIPSK